MLGSAHEKFGVWTGPKETVKDKDRPVDRERNIKEDTEMLRLPVYLHSLQYEAGGKWDILAYLLESFFASLPRDLLVYNISIY